jgi:hypothetical protein
LYRCRSKNLLVIVVDAALDVLNVDGHEPYEMFVVTCHKSFAQPREAAQQGRSVLFSDEQKLLFKGSKNGVAKNTKLNFMRR